MELSPSLLLYSFMALCFGTGIPIMCFISINHHDHDLVVMLLSGDEIVFLLIIVLWRNTVQST
jgi:hypothetical protein